MNNEPIYEVYHKYEQESLFEGTHEQCQEFLSSYGGGWTALDIIPKTTTHDAPAI